VSDTSTQVGAKPRNKNEHIFEKKGGTSNEESIKSTKNPYTNQTPTSIILLARNVRDLTRSKKNKTSQKLGYVLIHNQSATHNQIMSHDQMNSHQQVRKYGTIVCLCLHILYYISYMNFSFPCRVFGYCK
jgi:hypothetical protein